MITLKNDDALLHYEQYEPVIEPTLSGTVTNYWYILEDAFVGCSYSTETGELYNVVVKDEKRDFIKQYNGHVLYSVYDIQLDNICSFLSIRYVFGKPFRWSAEECEEINQLLETRDYETISSIWGGRIVTTTSGTIFVE